MKSQVEKMLETVIAPSRLQRDGALSLPWNHPSMAVMFAWGKLSRIHDGHTVVVSPAYAAEECREVASYLLRAAELLEVGE